MPAMNYRKPSVPEKGKYKYLNFPKNLHSNTGTGDYFPKKVISS